jgi:hypothetical protein
MDILGGVVLIDPDTQTAYAAAHDTTVSSSWGVGILGGVVLIDPITSEAFKLGAN